jgi:hypothetical protein
VISETSRENDNDNDTLNAGESIDESNNEPTPDAASAVADDDNDNDSVSSGDTVNSVQRVQSV